jgi:hypothetical protein
VDTNTILMFSVHSHVITISDNIFPTDGPESSARGLATLSNSSEWRYVSPPPLPPSSSEEKTYALSLKLIYPLSLTLSLPVGQVGSCLWESLVVDPGHERGFHSILFHNM